MNKPVTKKLLLTRETIRGINQSRLDEIVGATRPGTATGESFCQACSAPSDVLCSRRIDADQ